MSEKTKVVSFAVMVAFLVSSGITASAKDVAKITLSPERLKGMKAAIADLEKGVLKQKEYPAIPYSPAYPKYIQLLKKECGLEYEVVNQGNDNSRPFSKKLREEVVGYNDIMRAEIEHRFGRDIFSRLQKQAKVGKRAPR